MSKDIVVFTALDAKVSPAEALDILLLSTEGAAPMKVYNDLEIIKQDFAGKKVAAMADRMFNQDGTLADTLIRKVRIAGIENPQNVGGAASTICVTFDGASTENALEPNTDYYLKIGGKVVLKFTTGDTAPASDAELAALLEGAVFTEDGVTFEGAFFGPVGDDNEVDEATAAAISEVNGTITSIAGQKDGLTGCTLSFDETSRTMTMALSEPASGVKNTGLFDTLTALIADGYTITIEGSEVSGLSDFAGTEAYSKIMALEEGSEDVRFEAVASKGDVEIIYTVVVSYPGEEAGLSAHDEGGEETRESAGVLFTSTTRTPISGYTEDVGLYKDADCFESVGLSGAIVAITVGTADTTKAENLIAAIEELRDIDDDFYFVLTDVTDEACVTALAEWAESTEPTEAALGAGVEDHRKFYVGQVMNKAYVNNYGRTCILYVDDPAEWADAALVGCVGPFWPESVTWKWKRPDGITLPDLRDSERDTLEENRVNFLTAEYKHEYIKNGICGDGNFVDNVLGADYITYQIRENLYEIFLANKKIGYTDEGFAIVGAGVFSALNRAVDLHIVAKDAESQVGVYTVQIPKRADATDEQARNRQMPNIEWEALLEGAVHGVKVRGVLSVTLNS